MPGEKARHDLGWQAAQDTRPEKKTRPLEQLLVWWRSSALVMCGQQMVDGLLNRYRALGAAVRARVDPVVDTMLAAVDVAPVVFTVPRNFARRHVLAEARPAPPGDSARPRVRTRPGRLHRQPCPVRPHPPDHRSPARPPRPGRRPDLLHRRLHRARPVVDHRHRRQAAPGVVPLRAGPGRQPRRTQRDPRRPSPARPAGRRPASRPGINSAARRRPPRPGRRPHAGAAGGRRPCPPAGRDARGVSGGPYDRRGDVAAHTGEPGPARRRHPCGQRPPPRHRGRTDSGPGARPGRAAPPRDTRSSTSSRAPVKVKVRASSRDSPRTRPVGRKSKPPRQQPGRNRLLCPEAGRERRVWRGLRGWSA